MAKITQLTPAGLPGRRYGSFADKSQVIEVSASSTLTLSQNSTYVAAHWFEEDASSTLTLTQDATYTKGHVYEESADSTLTLSQDASSNFFKRPGSLIQLRQTATYTSILNRSVTSTIVFISTSATKGILQTSSNTLTLTQTATFIKSVPLETNSSISLTDEAVCVRYRPRSVTSYLVLTQSTTGIAYFLEGIASSTITLTQDVSVIQTRNLLTNGILVLTETAARQFIADREPNNTLVLNDYAFCLTLKEKKYAVLHAPYNTCLGSIVLPNPIFGDTEGTTSDVIVKRSMSGATRTYVKRNSNRRLKYTFVLTRTKGLELIDFIRSYGSEQIMLQNWKGEVWKVNIITNPFEVIQGGRWYPNGARTEVNLEFEGERVS